MELILTHRFHFAASHRLFAPELSEAENEAMYGKCAWKNGHGHNYVLEVSIAGVPDPVTGFLLPPDDLKEIVDEWVVREVDHRHLNHDVDFLREIVPTAELLARRFYERLQPRLPSLVRVTLHETPKNVAVYGRLGA